MEELIKYYRQNGRKVVSARELHTLLESRQDFTNWIKGRIEKYGFQEGKDFSIILSRSEAGRHTTEYAVTINMAKELGMVEGNDVGKKIRRYFIEVEKTAKPDFTPVIGFEENAKRQNQLLNSKEVNTDQFEKGGTQQTIQYNLKNCQLHTGGLTPSQIKKKYAKSNLPAAVKNSAKEILRKVDPVTACAMSLTDNMVKLGGDHEKAAEISNKHGREVFKFMFENGMIPGEFRQSKIAM